MSLSGSTPVVSTALKVCKNASLFLALCLKHDLLKISPSSFLSANCPLCLNTLLILPDLPHELRKVSRLCPNISFGYSFYANSLLYWYRRLFRSILLDCIYKNQEKRYGPLYHVSNQKDSNNPQAHTAGYRRYP